LSVEVGKEPMRKEATEDGEELVERTLIMKSALNGHL
jgi:hypothetical protein